MYIIYACIIPGCTGKFFSWGSSTKNKNFGQTQMAQNHPTMGGERSGDRKTIVGARKTIPES